MASFNRLQLPVPTPRPYAGHVARFAEDMLRERGLSPDTVVYRCRSVEDFLAQLTAAGLGLGMLTVAQVDDLLARKVRDGEYTRPPMQTYASTLRALFRFA